MSITAIIRLESYYKYICQFYLFAFVVKKKKNKQLYQTRTDIVLLGLRTNNNRLYIFALIDYRLHILCRWNETFVDTE